MNYYNKKGCIRFTDASLRPKPRQMADYSSPDRIIFFLPYILLILIVDSVPKMLFLPVAPLMAKGNCSVKFLQSDVFFNHHFTKVN